MVNKKLFQDKLQFLYMLDIPPLELPNFVLNIVIFFTKIKPAIQLTVKYDS